jgi:3-hydroxymyristoyl/3-hydroxydecanoyl-(acyl carrier protein) dehydratase
MAADLEWRSVQRRIDPAHPTGAGHFPGNPIIPGAVLLAEILDAIGATTACGIRSAKFLRPVRPGDVLAIRWCAAGGSDIKFEAALEPGGLALSGLIVTQAAP